MTEFLTKNRGGIYALANVAFLLAVALASAVHGDTGVNVFYMCLLFALCSGPLLLLDCLNGRYVLLAILMAFFFLFFGMLSFIDLVFDVPASIPGGDMTEAQWGILCGGASLWIGYLVGARLPAAKLARSADVDWPRKTILFVGAALWIVGSITTVYLQVYIFQQKTIAATQHGLAELSAGMTFLIMLANLLAPLGTLILSYGYARSRTLWWLGVILFVLAGQIAIAFVTDIRGLALMPVAMVIVALTLTSNRVPVTWIVASIIGAGVIFPVLSAYRVVVSGQHGLSRAQAAANLGKVVDMVLAYRDKLSQSPHEGGTSREGGQTLFQRASLEANVERAFERTGVDVPFQDGHTLIEIPLAFIPRLVWPDKPGVPTGQLFNHEFFPGGSPDTYISPSSLGELYWNFGWPGMLIGLTLIGALLGFVGRKCDLSDQVSVTRVLVLLATVYYLCWGFEGAMDVSYVSWMRSLAAIGLFHQLFARRIPAPAATGVATSARSESKALVPMTPAIARFPNVMR